MKKDLSLLRKQLTITKKKINNYREIRLCGRGAQLGCDEIILNYEFSKKKLNYALWGFLHCVGKQCKVNLSINFIPHTTFIGYFHVHICKYLYLKKKKQLEICF